METISRCNTTMFTVSARSKQLWMKMEKSGFSVVAAPVSLLRSREKHSTHRSLCLRLYLWHTAGCSCRIAALSGSRLKRLPNSVFRYKEKQVDCDFCPLNPDRFNFPDRCFGLTKFHLRLRKSHIHARKRFQHSRNIVSVLGTLAIMGL